jgi:hypothetical protein
LGELKQIFNIFWSIGGLLSIYIPYAPVSIGVWGKARLGLVCLGLS